MLWFPFVIIVVAPIEIRIKVFLEKKLHTFFTITLGMIHAVSVFLLPFAYIWFLSFYYDCKSLEIGPEYKNLNAYYMNGKVSNNGFILYSTPMSNYIVFDSSFSGDSAKLHHSSGLKDTHKYAFDIPDKNTVDYVLNFNLHRIDNFRYHLIAPFLKNAMLAVYVYIADRLFLKTFCSTYINHICDYLILEEFVSTILFKYLVSFFNIYEKLAISNSDSLIGQLKNKEEIISSGLSQNINFHGLLHPSLPFQIFNNQTNLFSRLENILKS